jgi:ArsR family transcriptional regulator
LELLRVRDLTPSDMIEHLKISQPTLSHHLAILKCANLVDSEREGLFVVYALNMSVFQMAVEYMLQFLKRRRWCMKWNAMRDIVPAVVLVLFCIASAYFWSLLPDRAPRHFNVRGEAYGYWSKTLLICFDFGLLFFLYLLFTFIPLIDPFWLKIEKQYNIFLIVRDV